MSDISKPEQTGPPDIEGQLYQSNHICEKRHKSLYDLDIFASHANRALPLRNAQLQAALTKCAELEELGARQVDAGQIGRGRATRAAADLIRSAIEKATC